MTQDQRLVDIEAAFEDAKAARLKAKTRFASFQGLYHMKLMARREAGENLTATDMRAMVAASVETDEDVKNSYLNFIHADSDYRAKKVAWEQAKREYWDQKGTR